MLLLYWLERRSMRGVLRELVEKDKRRYGETHKKEWQDGKC